jgi:hypothetical protein
MSSWRSQRKIVTLPGAENHTPEVVLARTLEKARAGLLEGVVVAIAWKDGGASSDRSTMKVSSAAYALRVAEHDLDDIIFDDANMLREDADDC